ncbi:MAG: outer membrane lipoprotein carrier protein LolA [Betaproteobacteria bacterium]|nr:outer membrane lipoprotein carrier protein LolA [Betaproteobacteria bacterium]
MRTAPIAGTGATLASLGARARCTLVGVGALLLALGLGAPLHAQDRTLFEDIAAGLDPAAVIVSEFTQTRRIAALKQPVVSSGRVIFARGMGVVWQIERPYRYAYVLGAQGTTEVNAAGERLRRKASDAPALVSVGRVFEALLRADLVQLREHFHIELSGSPRDWRAELVPRESAMAGFMQRLVIKGGRQLAEIELGESNGDSTRIRLRHRESGASLAPADAALFSG